MNVVEGSKLRWETAGKAGLQMKTVRRDDTAGTFLGLIAFDQLVTTGVHQHLGTAFSMMLSGGLTDYAGTADQGEVGINFLGSTHDAIAYRPTLMVSRLEGPVVYGPDISHALHAGAMHAPIDNAFPDMPPDCNIDPSAIKATPTWVPGVERRLIFDYLPTGMNRRLIDLRLLPGATVPRHRLSGVLDFYVIAGDLGFTGQRGDAHATSGGFAMCEPDEEIALHSSYGAHVLVWAEGAASWSDGRGGPDFYGFDASYASPRGSKR